MKNENISYEFKKYILNYFKTCDLKGQVRVRTYKKWKLYKIEIYIINHKFCIFEDFVLEERYGEKVFLFVLETFIRDSSENKKI